MNKQKLISICAVVALSAVAVVGGTLAYFTDTDAKTNTFTVGDVKIRIDEWMEKEKGGEWVEYTDKQELAPIAQSKAPANKIVETVNEGSEDAYIRTFITCPSDLYNQLGYGFNKGTGINGDVAADIVNGDGTTIHKLDSWKDLGETTINGKKVHVFMCEHKEAIPAGDSILSLTKVWVYENVANEEIGDGFEVKVFSEGIQSENLTYAEAMKSLNAGKTDLEHATELFNK